VVEEICAECNWPTPRSLFSTSLEFYRSSKDHPHLNIESDEADESISFFFTGLIARRHFDLLADKLLYPHFFCWPGKLSARSVGDAYAAPAFELRENHAPLWLGPLNSMPLYIPPLRMANKNAQNVLARFCVTHWLVCDIFEQLVTGFG